MSGILNFMGVEWRDVKGYEGQYMVSSEGFLRNERTQRVLEGSNSRFGYKYVTFYEGSVKKERRYVHRIVCEAFNGPAPEGKPLVLHGDGDKKNNVPSNLRWGTDSENKFDAVRQGLHPSFSREKNRTHCKNGHPWVEENIYTYTSSGRKVNTCRTCHRATYERSYAKRKANA